MKTISKHHTVYTNGDVTFWGYLLGYAEYINKDTPISQSWTFKELENIVVTAKYHYRRHCEALAEREHFERKQIQAEASDAA